jgi:hypothetical protein
LNHYGGTILVDNELEEIADKLWPLIENNNCIAWIGSGLSKIAGYTDWPNTIQKLCKECNIKCLELNEEKSVDCLINKAEECKQKNLQTYQETLANLFGRTVAPTRRAFNLIMRLPFKGYVTTNFDPLLLTAGIDNNNEDTWAYPDLPLTMIEKKKHPIYYIHGLARHGAVQKGDHLILARSDFDEAYGNGGIVHSFLVSLLTYYNIIFLGCELMEPDIKNVFLRVHKIHEEMRRIKPNGHFPQRIILVSKQQIGQEYNVKGYPEQNIVKAYDKTVQNAEFERYNAMSIEPIRYSQKDEHYGEIEQILESILFRNRKLSIPQPRWGIKNDWEDL